MSEQTSFIRMVPLPGPQTIALSASDVKETLYGGARGGGKTFVGMMWIAREAIEKGGSAQYRGLVIRKNATDLCDWVDRFMQIFLSFGARERRGQIEFPCGAIIRLGHLADSGAYEKYQGHEYQKILLEELTQIPNEEDYLKLIASCRSTIPGVFCRVLCTANPGGPGHSWVKERWVAKGKPNKPFIHDKTGNKMIYIPARLSDNPYLDKTDYRNGLLGLPDQLRRAWLDGDWDALTGQFFTEWNPAIHVCDPFSIPRHWKRYTAMDWGYRPDPWVCLWFAVDEFGHEYLYREAYGNEMTPEEVGKRLAELSELDPPAVSNVADPSMWAAKDGLSSAEKMGASGWWITQANNDRANGAMRVREYLRTGQDGRRPWLTVFRSCQKTLEAIPAMIHDEKDHAKYGAHPLDHWTDAVRYHLMDRPSRSALPEKAPPEGSMEYYEARN